MSKSLRYTLLAGILIIAAFFRFYHFTTVPPGLYPDEAMDGNNAVEAAETNHFQVFYVEDNGREGLYVNIIAAFLKVWPIYEPWVIRLPAAIAGVLTVWGLYLLVAELFGNGPGLFVAFLTATSVWHITFSRIGFRAILAPLLLTWAFWLLIKSFRSPAKSSGEHGMGSMAGWWYAAAAGAVYSLGFYTYIAYRVTPALFLLFIPFFRKLPGFWKKTLLFILVTFIVAAPIGWYFVSHPGSFFGRTAQISVTNAQSPAGDFLKNVAKEALMFNVAGDYNWRQNTSGAPELFLPVGLLFILGIVLAIYSLIKSWRARKEKEAEAAGLFPPFALLLTFAWLAFGLLPAAASDEGIPHALRSIIALPAAMILASIGGIWLYQLIARIWNRTAAISLGIALIVICTVFAYTNYFVDWANNPNVAGPNGAFNAGYVAIGREINALPSSTPKYVIVNAGGVLERGIPTPAETTMFITHSFTDADAAAQNIHYIVPGDPNIGTSTIPAGTPQNEIFEIN